MKQEVFICRSCNKYTIHKNYCAGCDIIINTFNYDMGYNRSSFYGKSKEELLDPYNIVPEDQVLLKDKFKQYESYLVQKERDELAKKTMIAEQKRLERRNNFEKQYGSDHEKIKGMSYDMESEIDVLTRKRDKLNNQISKLRTKFLRFKRYLSGMGTNGMD